MRKRAPTEKTKLTPLEKLANLNLGFVSLILWSNRYMAEMTPVTTFIAYIPQLIWTVPTLILLPLCLFTKTRKKKALLACAVSVVGCLFLTGFDVPFPFTEAEGHKFTLMTFNIHHADSGWEGIRKVVLEKKPDIVCFQEADDKTHLHSAVGELPGYHVERRGGLAIASKEKLTDVREVQLSPGTSPALEAKVGEIKVVNVQLASFKSLNSPGNMKDTADIHHVQIITLIEKYAKELDCVIAGDFNTPPVGDNYRYLWRQFNDAFGAQGWGFGYTYPSRSPLIRIDYAFLTDIKSISAEVVATTQSDHRPVFFKLLLYRPT